MYIYNVVPPLTSIPAVGNSVFIKHCHSGAFIAMRSDGTVKAIYGNARELIPLRLFEVVNAGNDNIGLLNKHHGRYLRVNDCGVADAGGNTSDGILSNERFTVVDAGNGKIALHIPHYNSFLRIFNNNIDTQGGVKNVTDLPPENEWGAERFQLTVVPTRPVFVPSNSSSIGVKNIKSGSATATASSTKEIVDETGIDVRDIEVVAIQAGCSRGQAVKALRNNDHDIANAIMELTK